MADQPGSRNRRLKLRKPDLTRRPDGSRSGDYVDVADVSAKITTMTGMTAIRQAASGTGNVLAPVRYGCRINYRTEVLPGWRLYFPDGVTFMEITQARHDFADRIYTDLVCEMGAITT